MKLYTLPEETINQILNYLASKPYLEVTALVQRVQSQARLVADDSAPKATEAVSASNGTEANN